MMVPLPGAVFGDTGCPRIVAGPGFQFLHGQVLYDDSCCCQPRVVMLRSPSHARRPLSCCLTDDGETTSQTKYVFPHQLRG